MEDEMRQEEGNSPDTTGQKPFVSETPEMTFRRGLQIEQDDLVIFGEDGKFHLVQKATYTANELPTSLVSTAEFLVGLGAVVADVSAFDWEVLRRKLTVDYSCIVLNLASIRQLSEKKGKPITFLHGPDGKKPKEGRKSEHAIGKEASYAAPAEVKRHEPNLEIGRDDLVIFDEDRKFYWVKKDDYVSQSSDLPEEMRSAPELMVMLGVVLADIPRIPTAGTACRLLNLASVRRGSSYAAQLLAENTQVSRLPEQEAQPLLEELERKRAAADTALHKKKIQDALHLKEWAQRAHEYARAQPKPPVDVLQKMLAQQLRIVEDKQRSLQKLEKSMQAGMASPAGPPITGEREFRAASALSKRASGKRTTTARRTPRGGKK